MSRPRMPQLALLLILAVPSLGVDACQEVELPGSGAALFTSPQATPMALSEDGSFLYVANTTSGSVSVVDVSSPASPLEIAEIKVGLDPVGIAVRPKASPEDDELVFVTNHVSDSISVISRAAVDVVQTIQAIDPVTGVSTTDEPVGIAFAGPGRAFVALDNPNQVLVLDIDESGRATIDPQRLAITAQAPRALTVAGGRLFVAAFESGNQTEFPSCDASDPRGLDESDPFDEGCFESPIRLIDGILDFQTFDLDVGLIVDFAAGSPNIGGRVVRDRDMPDRDLFVFDAQTLEPIDVVDGVGTLLYDVKAGAGDRLYVTHTEARNQLDGLAALGNRMFDNRLAVLDCTAAGCGSPTSVDLDGAANALGVTVPTPYGLDVSGDGTTLVVSVAGSDGRPSSAPGTPPGQASIPGLVTLDADGNLLGAVQTGAIPQGVVLASDAEGAAATAYVLNTVESSVSVVDVSDPTAPSVLATVTVGSDPTPPLVRQGRIAFSSSRASTSGTFSCESCHPNGNMDQLVWTINSVNGPDEGPDPGGEGAEPRTTMPIRGLRDTLPLHWDGSLGDPFGGPNGADPDADLPPSCDLADEQSCFRDLVNASLRGVMCEQEGGCPTGEATDGEGGLLPGALDDADRDAMAAFLGSVSFPPSPKRRPTDVLTAQATLGVQDFFTDEDGLGVGGGSGVGNAVGFAPITCADNSGGCHALPLTVDTNSVTVGAFEAPSIRGLWDRWVIFSNGLFNSEEALTLAQLCADGNPPPSGFLMNDPCTLDLTFAGQEPLRPSYPSGETVWDAAVGNTERGSWMASFEFIFDLAYGVPGENIWEFLNEMSVGLPGLLGRQLHIDADNADSGETVDALAQIESAAAEGRITAVARNRAIREMRFDPDAGLWMGEGNNGWSGAQLRASAGLLDVPVTVTAELPENVSIGGADRQPLLDIEPESRATEQIGDLLAIPRFPAGAPSTSPLGYSYVEPDAAVFVDGELCTAAEGCSFELFPGGGFEGADVMELTLKALAPGTHVVQVQNPAGWFSNEMPVFAEAVP